MRYVFRITWKYGNVERRSFEDPENPKIIDVIRGWDEECGGIEKIEVFKEEEEE